MITAETKSCSSSPCIWNLNSGKLSGRYWISLTRLICLEMWVFRNWILNDADSWCSILNLPVWFFHLVIFTELAASWEEHWSYFSRRFVWLRGSRCYQGFASIDARSYIHWSKLENRKLTFPSSWLMIKRFFLIIGPFCSLIFRYHLRLLRLSS
jgi:hypothetical protein